MEQRDRGVMLSVASTIKRDCWDLHQLRLFLISACALGSTTRSINAPCISNVDCCDYVFNQKSRGIAFLETVFS